MALGEARKAVKNGNQISQVSWTDGTAQDTYYGLDHSFQYSSNINCDDELHGIKLATRASFTNKYKKCQLVSLGSNGVMALPLGSGTSETNLKRFVFEGYSSGWDEKAEDAGTIISSNFDTVPGVVFQDRFWFGSNVGSELGLLNSVSVAASSSSGQRKYRPYDHPDYTDESISTESETGEMQGTITAILNYNNTRLVVACGQDIWVYYPELDQEGESSHWTLSGNHQYYGRTGWKKTLHFEPGTYIVGLTCTFEYLKVRAVDEGWNTKVYYYQGNNNLRSTFVYNVIDLTGQRVRRVYSINGTDYFVNSIDGTDGLVNLNKMIGNVPVKLLTQRAGLTSMDINEKDPYFVGPVGLDAAYSDGNFYIADQYGVFKFRQAVQSYDKGYMKWQLRDFTSYNDQDVQVYGVCENQGFLYVSDSLGCWAMRLYDTGVDGYQGAWWDEDYTDTPNNYYNDDYRSKPQGVLISREFEGREGGTITKMLDEVRLNYELNPLTNGNGTIDVYVSPNNLRKSTSVFTEQNNWYHAMSIKQRNGKTRTEKSSLVNSLGEDGNSSFKWDWQTITYAIVIKVGTQERATPIVRQIDLRYHCKDKVNNVYDLNQGL